MSKSTAPVFRVYSAIPRESDGEDWLGIGLAVPHRDGKGFDVMLQALPINPKLVLRDCGQGLEHAPNSQEPNRDRDRDKLLSLKQQVDGFERALIEQCLLECGGKISAVMERLDVPRRTLSEKMARLGIDRHRLIDGVSTNASANRRSADATASDGSRGGIGLPIDHACRSNSPNSGDSSLLNHSRDRNSVG